jgi:hypothetical protein
MAGKWDLCGRWGFRRLDMWWWVAKECGSDRFRKAAFVPNNQSAKAAAYENVAEGKFVESVANAASSLWDVSR